MPRNNAKEAERIERTDVRQTQAVWAARQHALARGLEWDPQRPFEHWPTIVQRADAMFAMQDAQARHEDFLAAKDAGLVHLLHQGSPGQSPPPAGSDSSPSPGAATRAHPLGTRIRAALNKRAHRASTTGAGDGSRPLDEPRYITRSTHQYER